MVSTRTEKSGEKYNAFPVCPMYSSDPLHLRKSNIPAFVALAREKENYGLIKEINKGLG
jgi:hypothetical protein